MQFGLICLKEVSLWDETEQSPERWLDPWFYRNPILFLLFKFALGFHLSDVSCPVAACRESPPRKTSYEGYTTRALEGIQGAIPGAIQAAYIQGNCSVEISFRL